MKTPSILLFALSVFAIPAVAGAETAVVEATVTKAGKRTPVGSLTLDIAANGNTTKAEAEGAGVELEIELWRKPTKGSGAAPLSFRVEVERGRAGTFKLESSRVIKRGTRTVIGAFRRAGELLEVAITTRP